MTGTKEEREANRKAFSKMSSSEKVDYIFTYYKLPIFTAVVAVLVLGSTLYRNITKKDVVLYTAYANVVVGETLDEKLTAEYLQYADKNPKREEILVYRDLYISEDATGDDHQYAYASKLKTLGAISAKQLDLVLMNEEAYDLMSTSGLLMDLNYIQQENPSLYTQLEPFLLTNTVILDDNSIEFSLGEADEYEATTEEAVNGIDASTFPVFRSAGIEEGLCIAIIANSPHPEEDISYIDYLMNYAE